jgi:hypothetical protein
MSAGQTIKHKSSLVTMHVSKKTKAAAGAANYIMAHA